MIDTYFSTYPAITSPATAPSETHDGYYSITGRVDDVLNVSGHRMGTAEVESALVEHDAIAEAAVVGFPMILKARVFTLTSPPWQGVEPQRRSS